MSVSQKVTENAKVYFNVTLDRMDETGPRRGVKTYWRRADRREPGVLVGLWHTTKSSALLA